MVGVKGKYKGCNSCRTRRVKCDNTRPFCKKCTDHGRACEGYERETVFIVGTVDDKGRCASHPPRKLQDSSSKRVKTDQDVEAAPSGSSSGSHSSQQPSPAKMAFSPVQPPRPAWDETMSLASVGGLHQVRFVALHTHLDLVVRWGDSGTAGTTINTTEEVHLTLPASCRVQVGPSFGVQEFRLTAQCFVHLAPTSGSGQGASSSSSAAASSEGLCLFIYEQNSSASFSNKAPWKDAAVMSNSMRQFGLTHFQTFPKHHFFTRIYRPSAILASLLNRQQTHLSSPEWTTVPWAASHHKTPLDSLLDITVLIPSLLSRADRVTPLPRSIGRRLKAKDLLTNSASIERHLDAWYADIEKAAARNRNNPLLYWIGEPNVRTAQIPFADTFAFASPLLGLAHLYYWTSLIVLHKCMGSLMHVIFEDTSSTTPDTGSSPAAAAVIHSNTSDLDPLRYGTREIRKLAANVCRSLDWAMSTSGQPDLTAAPLWVVERFYSEVGDGELEMSWCSGFRQRLEAKGNEVEHMVGERTWFEVARFG